jgi:hypothetical protein
VLTRVPASLFATVALLAPAASAQESRAVLDAPLVVTTGYRLGTVLDLDGDGFQDAMGWWFNSSNEQSVYVRGFRNDGQGQLVAAGNLDVRTSPSTDPAGLFRLRKCDFDNDGRDDFSMVVNRSPWGGQSSLHVFQSNGVGNPREIPAYAYQGGTARVGAVLEDFDGDGTLDLAIAIGSLLSTYKYHPVAGGDPVATLESVRGLPGPTDDLFAIDGNGDGTLDVYANCGGLGWIVPVQNFQLLDPIPVPHGVSMMPMPVAGDIDGDQDEDLVVFGMSSYVVMRRTGSASWALEPTATGGPATNLCDVDQDGDLDGLCCGGGGPTIPVNRGPSTFRVSINQGGGRFAPAFEFPGLGSDHIAGAEDLDHDGDIDLVAGRCVYYARGPIREPVVHPIPGPTYVRAFAHDVDGDGDPDFRFGWNSVRRNLGSGQNVEFAPAYPAPPAGSQNQGPGYPGDFDGDGDVDLIVNRIVGNTNTAWLYRNNGGGGLVDAGAAGAIGDHFGYAFPGPDPRRSVITDVDGDGDVDLLVRNYGFPLKTDVRLNDGTGRFLSAPGAVSGLVIAVADFDADGIADLLDHRDGLTLFRGLGAGTFGVGEPVGPGPYGSYPEEGVDVGDLDADGDVDIVCAAPSNGSVEVFLNLGAGTFTHTTLPGTGLDGYPEDRRGANAVDVNGDGQLDLVCGPAYSAWAAAHVILRRADNTGWEPPFQQAIYAENTADGRTFVNKADVLDVDSDGDLDLVTDRVIRSARWHGMGRGKREQDTGGTPGGGGMEPTLGAIGPFHVGNVMSLCLTGARAGSNGTMTSGWVATQVPVFGGGSQQALHPMWLHSTVEFTTSGTPGVDGSGEWTLTYPVPTWKAGRTYVYRAVIEDPGNPFGQSTTNALLITYGL